MKTVEDKVMIVIDRDKLVKQKGNIDIPEFNFNVKDLKNLNLIIDLLIEYYIKTKNNHE